MTRQPAIPITRSCSAVVNVPVELGEVDREIIRCIAGELTCESLAWSTRRAGVDAQRRMAALLSRHLNMNREDLFALEARERTRLASYIVTAEMEERDTMPGVLAPLRLLARD